MLYGHLFGPSNDIVWEPLEDTIWKHLFDALMRDLIVGYGRYTLARHCCGHLWDLCWIHSCKTLLMGHPCPKMNNLLRTCQRDSCMALSLAMRCCKLSRNFSDTAVFKTTVSKHSSDGFLWDSPVCPVNGRVFWTPLAASLSTSLSLSKAVPTRSTTRLRHMMYAKWHADPSYPAYSCVVFSDSEVATSWRYAKRKEHRWGAVEHWNPANKEATSTMTNAKDRTWDQSGNAKECMFIGVHCLFVVLPQVASKWIHFELLGQGWMDTSIFRYFGGMPVCQQFKYVLQFSSYYETLSGCSLRAASCVDAQRFFGKGGFLRTANIAHSCDQLRPVATHWDLANGCGRFNAETAWCKHNCGILRYESGRDDAKIDDLRPHLRGVHHVSSGAWSLGHSRHLQTFGMTTCMFVVGWNVSKSFCDQRKWDDNLPSYRHQQF